METFIIDKRSTKDIMLQITQHRRDQKMTELARQNAVIVSGDSLLKIARNSRVKDEFLELAMSAHVVVACRVSPKQKAEIVHMVRKRNTLLTTLAIGDGANDVNMITAAHVGIGISGLEGQQAARSSDYAIGQFKFLKPLLFVHGREAYRRNSYLISYMFYKNTLLIMPIFVYGILSVFSGISIYDTILYQFYNLCFTGLPIMYFALYDFDQEKMALLTDPKYYKIGFKSNSNHILLNLRIDECFSKWVFWRWIFYGVWQGALAMFIVFYTIVIVDPKKGLSSTLLVDG